MGYFYLCTHGYFLTVLRGPYIILGIIQSHDSTCKTSTLIPVLSLWPFNLLFKGQPYTVVLRLCTQGSFLVMPVIKLAYAKQLPLSLYYLQPFN